MKSSEWLFLAALVSTLMVCSAARADSVVATFDNQDLTQPVTGTIPTPDGPVDAYISGLSWTGSGNSDANFNGNFTTYCIDLTHQINNGTSYTFTETSLSSIVGDAPAAQINSLYFNYFPGQGSLDTPVNEAAFQISIWDILTNSGAPITDSESAPFYVNSPSDPDTVTTANAWLSNLDSAGSGTVNLIALASDGTSQVQLFLAIGPSTNPSTAVPQPSILKSVAVITTMVMSLGILRRNSDLFIRLV